MIFPSPFPPPSGGANAYGLSKVDTELPGSSRSCAARSRRPPGRRAPETATENNLDHGAFGSACSRSVDTTRHKTAGCGLRRPRPQRRVLSRLLCALLVFHTHTVPSSVDPSRSSSQSRLAHAAADGAGLSRRGPTHPPPDPGHRIDRPHVPEHDPGVKSAVSLYSRSARSQMPRVTYARPMPRFVTPLARPRSVCCCGARRS
ncbi:hypothetical protein OH77DRAFT_398644 [Trametes cingulata]|nr:hypothetical protein OH77DRAFT_398644 [Trametes cingulata]